MGGPVVADAAQMLMKQADELAEQTAQLMPGAQVLVSLTHHDHLYSFGLSGELPDRDSRRLHNKNDAVCTITMKRNEMVETSDARKTPGLSDVASVIDGSIVGYLGYPLRDGAGRAIGAICALSETARDWSDLDKAHLNLARKEIEHLVATTLLQYEMQALSEAYTESDRVLMALAGSAKMMASVHSESGEVLFATRALLAEFDTASLQEAVAQSKGKPRQGGFAEEAASLSTRSLEAERRVRVQSGDSVIWGVVKRDAPGGVLFVSWRRDILSKI